MSQLPHDATTEPGLPRLPLVLEALVQGEESPEKDTLLKLGGLELRLGPELILAGRPPQLPEELTPVPPPRVFRVRVVAASSITPGNQERARLLFVGDGDAARSVDRLNRALENVLSEQECPLLPQPLDMWRLEQGALLLTDDHLGDKEALGEPRWWRQLDLKVAVHLLVQLTRSLEALHKAGFAMGGIQLEHLRFSRSLDSLALANLGYLLPLRSCSRASRQKLIRRELRSVGSMVLEAATGQDNSELLRNFHKVLDDAQMLIDAGVARPGLSQLLLGTLTEEPPFVYSHTRDLLQGLIQLQAELAPRYQLRSGMASTVGNFPLRRTDQDSCGMAEVRIIYHGVERHIGFYCVADGVGGEDHGERASQAAVHAALRAFHRAVGHYDFEVLQGNASAIARGVVKVAAQELATLGEVDPDENRGATTFTCALVVGDRVGIGHLGDSRAYLLRGGDLLCLTRDHNVANMKVALGQMTGRRAEEREDDQRRISRFLSTSAETPMSWIDGFDPCHLHKLIHPWESAGPRQGHSAERIYSSQNAFTTVATAPVAPQVPPLQVRRRHMENDRPPTLEFAQGPQRRIFDATTEQETRHATLALREGDHLILMSDGLYGEVSEADIARVITEHQDPEQAASQLLKTSMKALAMDNVTVLVVQYTQSGNNFDP